MCCVGKRTSLSPNRDTVRAILHGTDERPEIRFGWTRPLCGSAQQYFQDEELAVKFWQNYTNTNGGIMVNGTAHDINIVMYNDADDPVLAALLYERLATIDNVHAFFGPSGLVGPACYAIAQKYHIPVMSASDFSYYTQGNASNGTFGGWLFSSVPDPSRIFLPCFALLASKGVQTMSVAYSNDVLLRGFPQLHEVTARRYNMSIINTNDANDILIPDNVKFDELKSLVNKWKEENADVFSGSLLLPSDNADVLLHAIRYYNYQPKLIMNWLSAASPELIATGWQAYGVIGPKIWDKNLNFTDPFFGSSFDFYETYVTTVGREPGPLSLTALFGAVSLQIAIENADSLDGNAIRQSILSLNTSTFFGRANFSSNRLQRTDLQYYCFQIGGDGVARAISSNAPQPAQLVYPFLVTPPPGFLPSDKHSRRRLRLIIGLSVGIGMVALVGMSYAAYRILAFYEIIFIPKADLKGGWNEDI